jgi:uncharacterized protein
MGMCLDLEQYKPSKYNWYYSFNSTYLILNTLSWKIYKLDKSIYYFLKEKEKLNSNDFNYKNILNILLQEGLLQLNTIDENMLMYYKINIAKYDSQLNVTIIPTEECNFRCVYCYQDHKMGSMDDNVEKKVIKFFNKNIRKYKSINIEWFGGEPLLQKDRVIRIAQSVKLAGSKNHVPVVASMTTNGYLLDLETFEKLTKQNILYYQITLDGLQKIHDRTRPHVSGKGTYNKIIKNLLEIKEYSQNRYFRIAIRVNVNKTNCKYIEPFLEELKQHFNNDRRFIFFIETVKDWGGKSIIKMKDDLFQFKHQLNDFLSNEVISSLPMYDEFFESISSRMCHSSKANGFVINYDGGIYKCAKAMYEDEDVQRINKIGTLNINGSIQVDERNDSQWLVLKDVNYECLSCCLLPACIILHCPLSSVKKQTRMCLYKDVGNQWINGYIYNAYRNKKYIKIGE